MSPVSDDALLQLNADFPAAADYLSTILLIKRDYGEVHNTWLAARLGVSKPAVSQAVSRLKQIGVVDQDSYGLIELTDAGRDLAQTILRRHYLIEHLLIELVDFPWDKADSEAQRLQTVVSQELADHLYEAFGHPSVCPHGNPFPEDPAEAKVLKAPKLVDCAAGDSTSIIRITEEGEEIDGLLQFCNRYVIRPGASITVESVVADSAVKATVGKTRGVVIPWEFAVHLRVNSTR